MKTVTARQMRELDQQAIQKYDIPSLILMENAGRGVAELVFHTFKGRRVSIFCGKGNNGGDGLVVARHLLNRGFAVHVLLFCDPQELKEDPAVNYRIVRKMDIPVSVVSKDFEPVNFSGCVDRSDVVVDALFGVGLDKPVTGFYEEAILAINEKGKNIVAIDIPSGLHSDTGDVLGMAVKASITATLALPKAGLFLRQGPSYAGRVCVIDIGIPKQAVDQLRLE